MKDKIILITGANRGIGHNILKKIASSGYTVIGTSRSKDGADLITETLKDFKGKGIVMDVTNQESIDTSVSQIKDDYGVIYGLVNNAGITNDNLLMRMSDEQWNTVIETNLTSLYRVTKPGEMALTFIFLDDTSLARDFVKPKSPDLVAE